MLSGNLFLMSQMSLSHYLFRVGKEKYIAGRLSCII